jgi:hypothetical protein
MHACGLKGGTEKVKKLAVGIALAAIGCLAAAQANAAVLVVVLTNA